MILFKACPRCSGDVDTTYGDDVHCVQCGNRPAVVFPGPRILPIGARPEAALADGDVDEGMEIICPSCGTVSVVELQKLRPDDHTCYRCRRCGHIFSPAPRSYEDWPGVATS